MYFSGLSVGGYGRICLSVDQILQRILHLALRYTAQLYHLGADHPGSQCVQIRKYLLIKHGNQLRRRSRQQYDPVLLRFQNDPRCRSVIIVQYFCTFGHHGLFPVILRRLNISHCEKFCDPFHAVVIHWQFFPTDLCHGFLGQIILRGSQSAG